MASHLPAPHALPCFEGRRTGERVGEIRRAQRRLLSASDLMTGNDGLKERKGDGWGGGDGS